MGKGFVPFTRTYKQTAAAQISAAKHDTWKPCQYSGSTNSFFPGRLSRSPPKASSWKLDRKVSPPSLTSLLIRETGKHPPGRAEQDVVRTDVEVAELARVHYVKGETGKPRSRRVRNTCHMM